MTTYTISFVNDSLSIHTFTVTGLRIDTIPVIWNITSFAFTDNYDDTFDADDVAVWTLWVAHTRDPFIFHGIPTAQAARANGELRRRLVNPSKHHDDRDINADV